MNAKNAFQIELELDKICEFAKMQPEDKKWGRTGEAINASTKVYSYRVDHVHNEAYKLLIGMQRNFMASDKWLEIV